MTDAGSQPGAKAARGTKVPKPAAERRGLRTGYTTGACAAAAARAATRVALRRVEVRSIVVTLPNGQDVSFAVERQEWQGETSVCSVIKDAGDDPDVTHGAELVAQVTLSEQPGIVVVGGEGVATVTKAGLGLVVGTSAINPVPQRNITAMVAQELAGSGFGAQITIAVPGGEELARHTLNRRLGLLGGISILGTSGIVRPYSTSAYKASVVQAIEVAARRGHKTVVFTTGGKSERYAMELHPQRSEEAFIQVGDFVGVGLRHAVRIGLHGVVVVGMIGKLSKMANGVMQTHQAGSQVSPAALAEWAHASGADPALAEQIRLANTARHVLELCSAAGFYGLPAVICERVARVAERHVQGALALAVQMVDFEGELLGSYESPEGIHG